MRCSHVVVPSKQAVICALITLNRKRSAFPLYDTEKLNDMMSADFIFKWQ